MKTKNGSITTIHVSDVHEGNSRIPVSHINRGLNSTITNPLLEKADFLTIGGDFWDMALSLPGDKVPEILLYIHSLLSRCAHYGTRVRILEGTPSHDRKQSKVFKTINSMLEKPADLRYYDELCIDYEEEFDIHVLYVPDEWKSSTEKAWDDVQAALRKHKLEKVDMAVMHGMFGYQLPKGLNLHHHNEERYLSVVDRFISIGHVHTASTYRRIFAQGSHDRLKHGEEEPKGLMVSEIFPDKSKDKVTFVENKFAVPFAVVDVTDMGEQEASVAIDKVALALIEKPLDIKYIRVDMLASDVMKAVYKNFKDHYPTLKWSNKIVKVKESERTEPVKKLREFTSIKAENVVELAMEKMKAKGIENSGVVEKLESIKEALSV